MNVKTFELGPLQTNTYILWHNNHKEAIIIDPADEPDTLLEFLQANSLELKYIFLTHAHFDHVGAVPELKQATGASILLHPDELFIYEAATDMAAFWGYDMEPLPNIDKLVKDGEEILLADQTFTVLHTPGHSPGSVSLYGNGLIFTGDTIFAGSVGRTDFEGGDINKLGESFRRIMQLPEDTKMLPGHGPSSTIGREKRENPFSAEFL